MNLFRTPAAAAALALLAACSDRQPLATTPQTPAPAAPLAAYECRADLRAGSVTCATPSPSASGARGLILGGQHQYVELSSSAVSYDSATKIFRADVTVQNLLPQQSLGTPDGVTVDPEGIRVFMHTGPTVTGGTGSVSVANPDGTGTFTAAGQPFFRYPGILAPGAVTAAKTWQFSVDTTVTTFAFTVYLDVKVQPRLVINEIMAHPATGDGGAGEWFEVYNAGIGPVDLDGYTIASGGDAGHTISGSLVVPTHGYVVLGGSTDTTATGGAAVSYAYSGVTLGNDASDWLALRIPTGVTADSVDWGAVAGDTPSAPATGVARALVSPDTSNLYLSGAQSAWGSAVQLYGLAGQRGTPGGYNLLPVHAVSLGSGGYNHSCLADTGGQAWCSGSGVLSLGNPARPNWPRLVPVAQPAGIHFARVATTQFESCALSDLGQPYCWGIYVGEQHGETPQPLVNPIGGLVSIVATAGPTTQGLCALNGAGTTYCWGNAGMWYFSGVQELPSTPPGPVAQLAAGKESLCAVSGGRVYCVGNNAFGALGDSTTVSPRWEFVPTRLPAGVNFTAVAAAGYAGCAVSDAGQAYCWGSNNYGQLGRGTVNGVPNPVPEAVQQPAGVAFTSISMSEYLGRTAVCALTAAGQAYCWGSNVYGRLGDGTETQRTVPTPVVQRGVVFSTISVGGDYTCALEQGTGQPFCWGKNDQGQTGDGTVATPRLIPVAAGR